MSVNKKSCLFENSQLGSNSQFIRLQPQPSLMTALGARLSLPRSPITLGPSELLLKQLRTTLSRSRGELAREGEYWSLSLVTQSRDVYILPSRFVCLPHLFNNTRPRIPIGYEPRAVPLIICVILCLSAPVRSFGRDHSVSFCVFCVFLRLFEISIGNNSSRHTRHHRNIIPPASHFHSRHIYTISNSLHNISHHN